VQYGFAALGGKCFLSSDIAQDLPVRIDMHVPTLARMQTSNVQPKLLTEPKIMSLS